MFARISNVKTATCDIDLCINFTVLSIKVLLGSISSILITLVYISRFAGLSTPHPITFIGGLAIEYGLGCRHNDTSISKQFKSCLGNGFLAPLKA